MTDDRTAPPLATWFWIAAIATLLFELFGAASIGYELTLDPASLPPEQREMSLALPAWMKIASVVAVSTGVCGAIGLLLRRRWAVPLLLVSLVAVVIQDSAYVIDQRLATSLPSGALIIPAVILLFCGLIYGFARHSRVRGWLV